jgi:AraC-like DNA-binding protein
LSAITEIWHRFDIRRIDDLHNAIWGADLDAIQMPGHGVRGSLAFAARDGIVFSSGLIDGNVMIAGPLSEDCVTLGVILRTGPGSRLWLEELKEGDVGIVQPGEECDFLCTAGSLYVAATLTRKQLRREVARDGVALPRSLTGGAGLHPLPLDGNALTSLLRGMERIHKIPTSKGKKAAVGSGLLRFIAAHYVHSPACERQRSKTTEHARIVRNARGFIRRNLDRPISLNAIATAAGTSPRTLCRAFSELLGDTPQNHVRRLRLHRIRRELISVSETTVSAAAHHWGIGQDLGRFSRSYRELFGENPSSTLEHGLTLRLDDTAL